VTPHAQAHIVRAQPSRQEFLSIEIATLMLVIATCAAPRRRLARVACRASAVNAVSNNHRSPSRPFSASASGAEGAHLRFSTAHARLPSIARTQWRCGTGELGPPAHAIESRRGQPCLRIELFWHTDLDGRSRSAGEGQAGGFAATAGTARRGVQLREQPLLSDCALRARLACRRAREGFVLHWSSERPVPRITIDYGDGRRSSRRSPATARITCRFEWTGR